uniref:Uncharacterized protein n=1 Tax=Glossina brevipalpis TaxID=37001 RepID=A0A1A9WQB2_9MUSC
MLKVAQILYLFQQQVDFLIVNYDLKASYPCILIDVTISQLRVMSSQTATPLDIEKREKNSVRALEKVHWQCFSSSATSTMCFKLDFGSYPEEKTNCVTRLSRLVGTQKFLLDYKFVFARFRREPSKESRLALNSKPAPLKRMADDEKRFSLMSQRRRSHNLRVEECCWIFTGGRSYDRESLTMLLVAFVTLTIGKDMFAFFVWFLMVLLLSLLSSDTLGNCCCRCRC